MQRTGAATNVNAFGLLWWHTVHGLALGKGTIPPMGGVVDDLTIKFLRLSPETNFALQLTCLPVKSSRTVCDIHHVVVGGEIRARNRATDRALALELATCAICFASKGLHCAFELGRAVCCACFSICLEVAFTIVGTSCRSRSITLDRQAFRHNSLELSPMVLYLASQLRFLPIKLWRTFCNACLSV
jgi:hypothetical protein